jgi:hypothetical protein
MPLFAKELSADSGNSVLAMPRTKAGTLNDVSYLPSMNFSIFTFAIFLSFSIGRMEGDATRLTFKLRGWPPPDLAGAPKVKNPTGRKECAYGQSLSNAGLGRKRAHW